VGFFISDFLKFCSACFTGFVFNFRNILCIYRNLWPFLGLIFAFRC